MAIAPTTISASLISGLLDSAASSCGESAVISVLMASAIGWGEFWADRVSGKLSVFCVSSADGIVDWSSWTAGKFDRPQIIARHT